MPEKDKSAPEGLSLQGWLQKYFSNPQSFSNDQLKGLERIKNEMDSLNNRLGIAWEYILGLEGETAKLQNIIEDLIKNLS